MSQALNPTIDDLGQTEHAKRTLGFSPGKFAMWLFIGQDAMGFVGLLSAYLIIRSAHPGAEWIPSVGNYGRVGENGEPLPGLPHLNIVLTGINTFILIVSSFTMVKALDAIQRGNVGMLKAFLAATVLLGATFLGIQVYEYQHLMHEGMHMNAHPYASTFFICTGFHGAHVLSGVIYLTCILVGAMRGKYTAQNHSPVELAGLFWHFVDLVWIILFTIIYLF
jgi:heme/copper-type cytochrome/quinol oxidase subunit 3